MRCKRCGNPLDPMDTRCPVCGKTLTPSRKKTPAQKPAETTVKLPQLDKFTHAYGQDAARSRMLQLVTVAAVAVAIALLAMVYAGVGDLQTAVNDLKLSSDTQFQALRDQPPADAQPATEPEPTEDATEEATIQGQAMPLAQQAVEASVMFYHAAEGTYLSAGMDLGDYDDQAAAWIRTAADGSTAVAWILDGSDDRLDLTVTQGDASGIDVSLEWTLKGQTFSGLSGTAVCIWEYRVAGGSWASMPNEYVVPSQAENRCDLALSAEQLAQLLGDYSQMELRCHVNLSHPGGGTMKIVAEGMVVDTGVPEADSDVPG